MGTLTRLLATSIVAVLLVAGTAQAVTYTVPLCTNRSFTAGHALEFSLDLGTALSSVQSVNLQYDGKITAGRYSNGTPFDSRFNAGFHSSGGMYTTTPYAGADTWPNPEPLSGTVRVPEYGAPNWAFLLDGVATGYLEIGVLYSMPEDPPLLSQASGYMNSASLIIEATPVPEPAGLVLLAVAAIVLNRRRA